MRMRGFVALLIVLMLSNSAYSMKNGFGIGLIIGEPTGFIVKKWLAENTAVDGAVAWSFDGRDALHLHGDYLVHDFTLLQNEQNFNKGRLPVYYGLGARVKFKDDSHDDDLKFGIRVPLGISYIPSQHPLDFFVEVVPTMDFAPDTELDLSAAVGMRYYFE